MIYGTKNEDEISAIKFILQIPKTAVTSVNWCIRRIL